MREAPSAALAPGTSPKIVAVFTRVRDEERALADGLAAFERRQLMATVKLESLTATTASGGQALVVRARVTDPRGAVSLVRVPYRRALQPVFSTLALESSEAGRWVGSLPAGWTASPRGFELEYFVEALDDRGVLATAGTADAPLRVAVSAGAERAPKPLPRVAFLGAAVATGAVATLTGGLGLGLWATQQDYRTRAPSSDGAVLGGLQRQGEALAVATNVGWVTSLGLVVVTLVVALLTDFGA